MNKMRWTPVLAFTLLFSAAGWSQADAQRTTVSQGLAVTLWMDWKRGDSHYGKDFIELHRSCEREPCVCVVSFKVISAGKNAREFADYVSSFEQGKVPIVYELLSSKEGRFVSARFLRVGDWTSDRFHPNDGVLGVQVTFKAGSDTGRTMPTRVSSPANCFPPQQR